MKIGIYKPGKKIFFNKNIEDHASWSNEIINVAKILISRGHEVYICSPTDYENTIEHLYIGIPESKLEKVFIFNGVWGNEINEKDIIAIFKIQTEDVSFICTDIKLMTQNKKLYKEIFVDSMKFHKCGYMFEHNCFNKSVLMPWDMEKTIPYYFGGTERGRTKDFFEYIVRSNCEWYGKSESLGVIKYLPFDEHIEKLKQAKTTILIADELCNELAWVTHRYYESAMLGVICFADSKFDPDELIMKKSDWRRVSSYKELLWKQKRIDEDPELAKVLIENQYVDCKQRQEGINIYNALMS